MDKIGMDLIITEDESGADFSSMASRFTMGSYTTRIYAMDSGTAYMVLT